VADSLRSLGSVALFSATWRWGNSGTMASAAESPSVAVSSPVPVGTDPAHHVTTTEIRALVPWSPYAGRMRAPAVPDLRPEQKVVCVARRVLFEKTSGRNRSRIASGRNPWRRR
jgi:hypothetical protein